MTIQMKAIEQYILYCGPCKMIRFRVQIKIDDDDVYYAVQGGSNFSICG